METFTRQPDRRVFFFDEARFGLQPQIGRAWTLKGVKQVPTVQPGYSNFYFYSAVSPFTGLWYSLFLPTAAVEVPSRADSAARIDTPAEIGDLPARRVLVVDEDIRFGKHPRLAGSPLPDR